MTDNIPAPAKPTFPRDAAKVIFWFDGLPQPIGFLLTEKDADMLQQDFQGGSSMLVFKSYPDNTGTRSTTSFAAHTVRGIAVETHALQLA